MSFRPVALVLTTDSQTPSASERVERLPHACYGLIEDEIKIVEGAT